MYEKRTFVKLTILLMLFFSLIQFPHLKNSVTADDVGNFSLSSIQTVSQQSKLVIYTYESLMADPAYDIEGNFSKFAGIDRDSIVIQRFDDANEIVTRLLQEKDSPQADVVIGIDNALIHLIEDKTAVLEKLTISDVPVLADIDQNLIANLDPDQYLLPYDYGIISLWYDNSRVNQTMYPELVNMTLDKLLESDLLSRLIVENPKFSSPGLGFLLWTIAVYGDSKINFEGLLGKDWRDWWEQAKDSITITKSWGSAFDIFFAEEEDKPIMVSYGTSPAYGYCLGYDGDEPATTALLSHEGGKPNAWLQIEGIGVVKGAPHSELAKKFINWFLDADLQSNLPTHQWMYPANTKASIPNCFTRAAIHPNSVNRLNDLISPSLLRERLLYWQDEWEIVVVLGTTGGSNVIGPGFGAVVFILLFGFVVVPIVLLKRKKRHSH